MPKKFTYEEVYQYFIDQGCMLITTEYKGNDQKLTYICVCGEEDVKMFRTFKLGQRCFNCGIKKRAEKKRKYNLETAKKYYKEHGCTLLADEYINTETNMRFICVCGNIGFMNFYSFKSGVRCVECKKEKLKALKSFSYEEVKEYFESFGCKLISESYNGVHEKLLFICSCGEKYSKTFSGFKNSPRCRTCSNKSISKSKTKKYEDVNFVYNEAGCTLLNKEYNNQYEIMYFICKCGKVGEKSFQNFVMAPRCIDCHLTKNPNLTDEERELKRYTTEYKHWRSLVYERDDYTCQCCGMRGQTLNAHHKDAYHWCIERRYDIANGVTLCGDCHHDFHNRYGQKYNTEDQYVEFIEMKNKERSMRMSE